MLSGLAGRKKVVAVIRVFSLSLMISLLAGYSLALQLPFETAAVGRVQGDSFTDLEKALGNDSVSIGSAEYYTSQSITGFGFSYGSSEADKTLKVLQQSYGLQHVNPKGMSQWQFNEITSKRTPTARALILQSQGIILNSKARAFDSYPAGNNPLQATPLSGINLADAIEGQNLVISDVDYAGTYLPSMGKQDSFSSQLSGKAGALIATNGLSNPAFVRAFVCSLALQDKGFGAIERQRDNYYYFSSLGDRFRNARNNIAEFGSGSEAVAMGDYSLYGAPYAKVEGSKQSEGSLRFACGDLAKYNTFPSTQSVLAQSFSAQSGEPVVYTKAVSLDFSQYSVIEDNNVQIIDVNGAMQNLSEGELVLPFAITRLEFPLGTIVRSINVISKSNPITLNLGSLPSWRDGSLSPRSCSSDHVGASAEFSPVYTEDRVAVSSKIMPVEVVDCNAGVFTLYKDFGIEVEYTPYSPVLLKEIGSKSEAFPQDLIDVNIFVENITPQKVDGLLKVLEGKKVVSERPVSISAGSSAFENVPVLLGKEEGFYDYSVVFDQNGEEKSRRSFKVNAQLLKVNVAFAGSKRFFDDFESVPLVKRWGSSVIAATGNVDQLLSFSQTGGNLEVVAQTAVFAENDNKSGSVEGKVTGKEGLAIFDDDFSSPARLTLNFSAGGKAPEAVSGGSRLTSQWLEVSYPEPRSIPFPKGELVMQFRGLKGARYDISANPPIVYFPYGHPSASVVLAGSAAKLQSLGVITYIPRSTDDTYGNTLAQGNFWNNNYWILDAEKYCSTVFGGSSMHKGCVKSGDLWATTNTDRVWGVFAAVNGKVANYQDELTSWIWETQTATPSGPESFNPSIIVSPSTLQDGYNEIEVGLFINGQLARSFGKFRVYIEPNDCSGSGLAAKVDSGHCAGNIRFSAHELPLTVIFAPGTMAELRAESGSRAEDFSGSYTIDVEDADTLRWSKDGSGRWNYIDVSGWDMGRLGFEFYAKSYTSYNSSNKNLVQKAIASASIIDGSHSARFAGGETNYGDSTLPSRNYDARARIIVSEIMRPYSSSARGRAFARVDFENRSEAPIELREEYLVSDQGTVVASGKLDKSIPVGSSSTLIPIDGLRDANKEYTLSFAAFYNNRSKFSGVSFSGNTPPKVSASSYIVGYALSPVVLDYSVFDPDGDALDVNVGAPFSESSVWVPRESDVGLREIIVSASDGFETVQKEIVLDVLPARVVCQVDSDCGSVITLEPRVCTSGSLYAKEVHPVCMNAGGYGSYCSSVDVNRVYGYCALGEGLSGGSISRELKFDSAGEKSYSIALPRKAIVKSAVISLSGRAPYSACFDAASSYDSSASTAIKYDFANGVMFVGLPLGPQIPAGSREITSGGVGAFPGIVFTPSVPGVAGDMYIYASCGDIGNAGRYAEFHVPCDNGYETFSSNFIGQCNRNSGWIGASFMSPVNSSQLSDFCEWGTGQNTATVAHNINTVYLYQKGYYGGIGDSRPAFRASVQQFQSGKELYLGSVPFEVRRVAFSAGHDLRGQGVDYYVTGDGLNWRPIGNNSSVDFSASETEKAFNWKAVLSTSDPAKTPRISSANICIETFASPAAASAVVGNTSFALPGGTGFAREIDIAAALNDYISLLPMMDGNVLIPVRFSAGSQGIFSLDSITYEYDVSYQTAPVIEDINEHYTVVGEPFRLQINAVDPENDVLSFSDDSPFFDINSETGLVSFTPSFSDAGDHIFSITVSDGNFSSSKAFLLHVMFPDLRIALSYPKTVKVGETIVIVPLVSGANPGKYALSIDSALFSMDGNAFVWRTDYGSAGDYDFTVAVADGSRHASATASFAVVGSLFSVPAPVRVTRDALIVRDVGSLGEKGGPDGLVVPAGTVCQIGNNTPVQAQDWGSEVPGVPAVNYWYVYCSAPGGADWPEAIGWISETGIDLHTPMPPGGGRDYSEP